MPATTRIQLQSGKNCATATLNRDHQRRQRADIRHEAEQPRHDANQQTETQSRQRQPDRIVSAEDEADAGLAAHEAEIVASISPTRPRTVSRCGSGIKRSRLSTMLSQSQIR